MRRLFLAMLPAVLAVLAAHADAGERITIVPLPPKCDAKPVVEFFSPGDYILDRFAVGFNKVKRFDARQPGDVDKELDDAELTSSDITPANSSKLAKTLKSRLLLFTTISSLTLTVEEDDLILVKRQSAVCTATIEYSLYDHKTGKTVKVGPYVEEERKAVAKGDVRRRTTDEDLREKLVKSVLDKCTKRVRAKIYKLYPLHGKVTASADDGVTLDIGSAMGVKVGFKFVVHGMVERENPITGLPERVREELSRLEVTKVTEDSAVCKVIKGEKAPGAGTTVKRYFKD